MEIRIETATARLLGNLYEIEKQCFSEEAFSKQQISYLLTDYNSVSLVARVDGVIAGFVIGRVEVEPDQSAGHIMTIDVLPAYRRQGIAKRLLIEVEEIFRQKKVREIRLEAREGNLAALELYGKLGYTKISRLQNYYGSSHGIYLSKILK